MYHDMESGLILVWFNVLTVWSPFESNVELEKWSITPDGYVLPHLSTDLLAMVQSSNAQRPKRPYIKRA